MYKLVFTEGTKKEYAYLYHTNKKLFSRIRAAIRSIAENPYQGKPLKFTLKGRWSYRVGIYRIIYSIQERIITVYILDIGHRREIYR